MTTGHRDYQRQLRNDNNNINEQLLSNCNSTASASSVINTKCHPCVWWCAYDVGIEAGYRDNWNSTAIYCTVTSTVLYKCTLADKVHYMGTFYTDQPIQYLKVKTNRITIIIQSNKNQHSKQPLLNRPCGNTLPDLLEEPFQQKPWQSAWQTK